MTFFWQTVNKFLQCIMLFYNNTIYTPSYVDISLKHLMGSLTYPYFYYTVGQICILFEMKTVCQAYDMYLISDMFFFSFSFLAFVRLSVWRCSVIFSVCTALFRSMMTLFRVTALCFTLLCKDLALLHVY